jgi:hypothetical protein
MGIGYMTNEDGAGVETPFGRFAILYILCPQRILAQIVGSNHLNRDNIVGWQKQELISVGLHAHR